MLAKTNLRKIHQKIQTMQSGRYYALQTGTSSCLLNDCSRREGQEYDKQQKPGPQGVGLKSKMKEK